jgi:hypothetical protein
MPTGTNRNLVESALRRENGHEEAVHGAQILEFAKDVRASRGKNSVTDGPFIETKQLMLK